MLRKALQREGEGGGERGEGGGAEGEIHIISDLQSTVFTSIPADALDSVGSSGEAFVAKLFDGISSFSCSLRRLLLKFFLLTSRICHLCAAAKDKLSSNT